MALLAGESAAEGGIGYVREQYRRARLMYEQRHREVGGRALYRLSEEVVDFFVSSSSERFSTVKPIGRRVRLLLKRRGEYQSFKRFRDDVLKPGLRVRYPGWSPELVDRTAARMATHVFLARLLADGALGPDSDEARVCAEFSEAFPE